MTRLLKRWLGMGILVCFVAACSSDEIETSEPGDTTCEEHEDCEDGFCIDEECIDDIECLDDTDCEDGVCEDDECVEDVECRDDDDCPVGVCEDEECVAYEFGEPCELDEECEGGVCIETEEDGRQCTEECESDVDCSDDGSWLCEADEEYGDICVPGPEIPPADGSTLCGAGGVSEGGGLRLTHCLAPYDHGSQDLAGDGVQLESGGFKLITE